MDASPFVSAAADMLRKAFSRKEPTELPLLLFRLAIRSEMHGRAIQELMCRADDEARLRTAAGIIAIGIAKTLAAQDDPAGTLAAIIEEEKDRIMGLFDDPAMREFRARPPLGEPTPNG